jgi:toxin ParE1/3/4
MSLPVVFRPAALAEYVGAIKWYESQQVGLGQKFEDEVEKLLVQIQSHAKQFPVVLRDIREALLSRFPYCVYYRIRYGRLIILAVFHTSRDPANWQSRV